MQRQNNGITTNKKFNDRQTNARGKHFKGQRQRHSIDSQEDGDDHHPGNYSPTSAMRWDRANDQTQDENQDNPDISRRSSLRSSSILGYDGEETTGPAHTPNPLDAVAADKNPTVDGKSTSRYITMQNCLKCCIRFALRIVYAKF